MTRYIRSQTFVDNQGFVGAQHAFGLRRKAHNESMRKEVLCFDTPSVLSMGRFFDTPLVAPPLASPQPWVMRHAPKICDKEGQKGTF